MRQRQVAFDAAFSLYMRDVYASAGAVTRYGWADSSPHRGREWFQCKEAYVKNSDIVTLARAVDSLISELAKDAPELEHEERERCNKAIETLMKVVIKMPQAKGEGATNVEHLAACFCQTSLWDTGTAAALQTHVDEYLSFCCDLGVDSGIRSFQVTSPVDLLPPWLQEELTEVQLQPDLGDDDAELPAPAPPQPQPLLKYAMEVPGSLHILSNLPKDLGLKLKMWKSHMAKLHQIEPLLVDKYHRDRLRATHFVEGSKEDTMFKKFTGSLYEQRWFSVYIFIQQALPLIQVLYNLWSAQQFVLGFSKDKADPDKDGRFTPHGIRRILDDPVFHSYNRAMLALGCCLKRMSAWLEACPCHSVYKRSFGRFRRQRRRWNKIFPNMTRPHCLISGCRAPELAAFGIISKFRELFEMSDADLMRKFPADLPDDDRRAILEDFHVAKAYLELGLEIKFGCWQKLPWKLAAMAYWDVTVKAAGARYCIELWESSMAAGYTEDMHHPLSIRFLSAGGRLIQSVTALATAGIVDPLLEMEIARLKFIPVVERAPRVMIVKVIISCAFPCCA